MHDQILQWTVFLSLLAILGFLSYRWLHGHFGVFKRLGIKGPEPTIVLGNMMEILRKGPLQALQDWHTVYGDTFGYFEGFTPVVVVSESDMVRQILVKDFSDYFPNRKQFPLATKKTHALFLARGKKWKRIRNILTPAFTAAKTKQMSPIINQAVGELIDNLNQKYEEREQFDVFENFQQLTLDVIGRSALGLNFTCQKNPDDPYLRNIRHLFESLATSSLLPFLMVFPFLGHLLVGVKTVFSVLGLNPVRFLINNMTEVIKQRKMSAKSQPSGNASRYVDLIELMLHSEVSSSLTVSGDFSISNKYNSFKHTDFQHEVGQKDSTKNNNAAGTYHARETESDQVKTHSNKPIHSQGLTEAEIISQSIVFLLSGYETSSTTLSFAAYSLITHPGIQQMLCQEIDSYFTNAVNMQFSKTKTEVNYDTVQSLPYLDMFFNEVVRMYPTAALHCTREAVRDWMYGDLYLPAGMAVQIHVWAIHHNPKYWENPDVFDPERFSLERKAEIKPCTYLPFGEGPRHCIGMRFAIMEAKITIVRLLQDYTLHRCEKTQAGLLYFVLGENFAPKKKTES